MGNKSIILNSFIDMDATLPNCGQKRMHLLCEVEYPAEQVCLDRGWIKMLYCEQYRADIK